MKDQTNLDYTYSLHAMLTRRNTQTARRQLWWAKKLLGPDRRKYSRMLFDLPPLEED